MDSQKHINNNEFKIQVQAMVDEIVSDIYNNASNMAKVNLIWGKDKLNVKSVVMLAVSVLLPVVLTSISLLVGWPIAVTGSLAFLGGVGSVALQMFNIKTNCNDSKISLKIDKYAKEKFKRETEKKVNQLITYISDYDRKQQKDKHILENRIANCNIASEQLKQDVQEKQKSNSMGYDITVDTKFGEWAQRFLIIANKSEDRAIANLGDELVTRLATMKIIVYDEPLLNSQGKPDVPFDDYLMDESSGEEYKEVVKPAIYSKSSLLARGEIC